MEPQQANFKKLLRGKKKKVLGKDKKEIGCCITPFTHSVLKVVTGTRHVGSSAHQNAGVQQSKWTAGQYRKGLKEPHEVGKLTFLKNEADFFTSDS